MWTTRLHIWDQTRLVEEILHQHLEVTFFSKDSADRVKQDRLRSSEESVKFKFFNNVYRCTVHFDVYKAQTPTKALFIKPDKVLKVKVLM